MNHTLKLIATNVAGSTEASAQVTVAEPSLPAWLVGVPLKQWVQIPKTRLVDGDLSPLASIPGAETGVQKDYVYGKPVQVGGIDSQSGGTFRKKGSELILFGGGGANSWAGNDIRGLRLEDDVPRWMVRSPPAGDYWPRVAGSASHPFTQTSKQPEARHSYWGPQFCDATDTFYQICCFQVWETDSAPVPGVNYVERFDWATKKWTLSDDPKRCPVLPTDAKNGWDGAWNCKHPVTEQMWRATTNVIHRFDPLKDSPVGFWWSWEYSITGSGLDRATACVDPDHNVILAIGRRPGTTIDHVPMVYDFSAGKPWTVVMNATFSGPHAGSIRNYNAIWGAGMVWDAGLHCFLWYQNDGFMYSITRGTSNADWVVDRLSLTGTPPVKHTGGDFVYGRMQYVPNLKGVVMQLRTDDNCWFVRTF